jgi:hypothetical protein
VLRPAPSWRVHRRRLAIRERVRGPWLAALPVAAVLGAILGGGLAVAGGQALPYRRVLDRGAAALWSTEAFRSNELARQLEAVLSGAPRGNRVALFTELGLAAADVHRLAKDASSIEEPPQLPGAKTCARALAERAHAVATALGAIEGLLGGPTGSEPAPPSSAEAALASAGREVIASDASWAACRRMFEAAPGRSEPVASSWPATAVEGPAGPAALVAALRAAPSMAVHHDLELGPVAFHPLPLLAPGSAGVVLPPTGSVRIGVLVRNAGNVEEEGVVLRAIVTFGHGAERTVSIGRVDPMAASWATLPAVAVAPGARGELRLEAVAASGASAALAEPVSVAAVPQGG